MEKLTISKNPNGKFLVEIGGAIPVGKPFKTSGGNQNYKGGAWISTKTNGSKSEHLYRVNIDVIDCGVKKEKK